MTDEQFRICMDGLNSIIASLADIAESLRELAELAERAGTNEEEQ